MTLPPFLSSSLICLLYQFMTGFLDKMRVFGFYGTLPALINSVLFFQIFCSAAEAPQAVKIASKVVDL